MSAVTRINVLGRESIVIGCDILKDCGTIAHEACKAARYVVISDENVAPLYLDTVLKSFEAATGVAPIVKVLQPGEQAKCREVKAEVEDWLIRNHCGRDATLVALGGGVIGDLTGYIAATYMRGIKVVQIPTTLLAMVDSSIGGKTGIDTPGGKNLVGAFHHPQRIIMDLHVLRTLPLRQLCNGMAEVVKTALLWDEHRFTQMEEHVDEILAKDPQWLQEIVEGSAGIKAEVVTKDEKEGGLRNILNVGHSVGHAVEAFLQPDMLHGEAVAIGIVKEAQISRRMGYLSEAELGRITRLLQQYKLPTAIPQQLTVVGLMEKMAVDKKNKGGKKYISLLERIGKCVNNAATAVEDDVIAPVIAHSVEVKPVQKGAKMNVTLSVPGSKSLSNRALLIAALGKGKCNVKGLLHSDDTQVMLQALLSMKACSFEWTDNGETLVLTGNGGALQSPAEEVFLGNAGTASRFLTTAATLASGSSTTLTGNKRMKERPIAPLVDALRSNGVEIDYLNRTGCLPIKINNAKDTKLPGGVIELAADVSSQYVSSVLISAPYAKKELQLSLVGGKVVSQPYIDMTLSIMKEFGVVGTRAGGKDDYTVPIGGYKNPESYQVEADASSATYPLAIPALVGSDCSLTVEGIGSLSVQGDAKFASLLEKMGCTVKQTEKQTTVTGSASRLKALDVDMEEMTDAFMTAAVVMALADGTSRITGIANQRVKECNRISAMITEFAKLGIVARELADGLEIDGTTVDKLNASASIFCYNDHRIAMSFAILGLVVPGIVIMDTACVEKTYPTFWDDLVNKVHATLVPQDIAYTLTAQAVEADESVVLVGIRGAGKTTLGQYCAGHLKWQFLDMDDVFEDRHGPIKEYIETNGWDAFRAAEAAMLEKTLQTCAHRHVIATGGGIVETEAGRKACERSKKIVFINKTLDDTRRALDGCAKPAWNADVEQVYKRRLPLFKSISRYELPIDASEGWSPVCRDALRLLEHVTQRSPVQLLNQSEKLSTLKSFLSLTFDDVSHVLPILPSAESGADALELRADLLADTSPEAVCKQLSLLRRRSDLPVIFTVRTASQGGKYPDDRQKGAVELLLQAARLGADIIDVEMTLKAELKEELFDALRGPLVLMSHHDPKRTLSWDALKRKIVEAGSMGVTDIVKIVTTAQDVDDCSRLRAAVKEADVRQPVIALAMGGIGKLSRALNNFMTPITHPSMPVAAAPGQLSMHDINQLRRLIGVLPDAKKFFLFGSPVAASRSPLIHNTGFQELGLAPGWVYDRLETENVEDVRAMMADPAFCGASVTIPLKQQVLPLCAVLTPAARQIGAVNTLTRLEDGTFEGDNTDWQAMRVVIKKHAATAPTVGLCIGAGGSARAACFALKAVGVKKLYICNRTPAKAEELAAEFGGTVVADVSQVPEAVQAVVSNIPGTAQNDSLLALQLCKGAVVVEMAYAPRRTVLLDHAAASGATGVEGIEVLIEQALFQSKKWTDCNPPRKAITDAVYASL
ncbi:Pentafunctional AROM polypeptide [Diplonema papillatum]|nr:Pentafunctional AROM polypeptide [Diplonema papillatum]